MKFDKETTAKFIGSFVIFAMLYMIFKLIRHLTGDK